MDVMVVDTTTQGKDVLDHLKRDNVGNVTLYCLDKMRSCPSPDQNNPGPRLVDQIKCDDPNLIKAFYKSCGDTLIANDSQQAQHMAFTGPRYRVVALTGELFEKHGTMQGGGSKPRSGAMGTKATVRMNESVISESEVGEMEEELNELRNKIREIDDRIRTIGNELRQAQTDVSKKSNRLELISASLTNQKEQIELVKSRIPEKEKLVKTLRPDKKKLEKIGQTVQDAEVELGAAKATADAARDKVEEINKQMVEIGQGRIEGKKKLIEKTKNEIKAAKKKIVKVQNDAKTAGRNYEKGVDAVNSIKTEIKEIEERRAAIESENQ